MPLLFGSEGMDGRPWEIDPRLRGRPDPGPFDLARMLPLTYAVAGLMLVMGVVLIVADIVEPIRLF